MGRKFSLLGKLYLAQLARNLKHLGIEKQFSILVLLDKMGSKCSQKVVGEMLHIDKTLMVGVMDDLLKKGFIKRSQNPNDRREYWIQLSAKGKKCIPAILETVHRLNKHIKNDFSKAEEKKLNAQLETIYKNLKDISNPIR